MRSLIPRYPLGDLMSWRDAMDRWFEQGLLRPMGWPSARGVLIDMYETKDAVIIKATVPGVKADDIDISIEGNVVTIKGEFKEEQEAKKDDYIRQERYVGSFMRSIELPTSVDADRAHASFDNGVLTLTLPKREEVKAKTIRVRPGTHPSHPARSTR